MPRFGFVRISSVCLRTAIADPAANVAEITRVLEQLPDSDIVLFPELCVTGYTCADLFGQSRLLEAAREQAQQLAERMARRQQLIVVGLPVAVDNGLYNCAAVLFQGRVLGLVPKQYLPNYQEYYESRWFRPGAASVPAEIDWSGERVPFGVDLLFQAEDVVVGIELCEDLWVPLPPSAFQAVAGANVLLNLSASNETIGKNRYRTDLVVGQSGRCIAAYAYASAGPTESTTDLVFGGHCLIAENGVLLAESPRVGDGQGLHRDSYFITADVDVERLRNDRRKTTSFDACAAHLPRRYRTIPFALSAELSGLRRSVSGTPFIPQDNAELHRRCAEIFGVQCAALAQRVSRLPDDAPLNLGVSGGLDSTLALLVAVKMCDYLGWPRTRIRGLTMPGFGTTQATRQNALDLMEHLGVAAEVFDIRPLCCDAFRALGHRPFGIALESLSAAELQAALAHVPPHEFHDLVFENVQARIRTLLLMSRGFVIGTGDLSEAALGWSTYNADHMSMYNPNCSIPKTLVRFLVRYVAEHEFEGAARETLLKIVATPISPELLPLSAEGTSRQATEASLGSYELHDFFLYHFLRNGFSPRKILFLSQHANFTQAYSRSEIEATLRTFYRRFFANQFKRSCVPDGPKVGSVSLSPRGDWRMPSDADAQAWLDSFAP
uniref:Glutamine-dependent NAD(+) synthetase n=1 Tax=Schlesneria paludicola TaxID=360056 RepID=A0A7C4LKZ4_9PLAN